MGFLYRILGLFLLVATLTVASGEYHYGRKEKKDQRYDGDKHDYKKMRKFFLKFTLLATH